MKVDEADAVRTGYKIRRIKGITALGFIILVALYALTSCTSTIKEKEQPESPFKPLPESVTASDTMENVDFSKFKHDSERHKTVPCLLCHQRTDDRTTPGYSQHTPCAGCHTPQFENQSHPICLVCHTGEGSEKLKPFPQMTSFRAHFDHAAHIRQTACSTCHQTRGTGMVVPAGSDAHSTCFQCHTSDKVINDRNIGSCNTCHELGPANRITDTNPNIGFGFSHERHGGVACTNCHAPEGANRMSAVKVAMHSNQANSCATCHNSKRAFGANTFANCRKCHEQAPAAKTVGVRFDHTIHAKNNCVTCHNPGRGVNFTVPNGDSAHNTCFKCHQPMKGGGSFTTGKCFTCHQPGGTNDIKAAAAVIGGNFQHTKHTFMDCDACHSPENGKMTFPTVAMHRAPKSGMSCATCHDNSTAFGEDFTNCKKCHVGGTFKTLPK